MASVKMLADGVTPANPTMFCMSVTPMKQDGSIDEQALRAHLQRMVDARVGVYLGSGGSGQGHALERDELSQVYRIGVEVCKGKIPTYCNPPEARTAKEMLWKCQLAIDAKIDLVQVYQIDPGHGQKPTPAEQDEYFRYVLERVNHPVALSIHRGAAGYAASVSMVAKLCKDFPQIAAVNLLGIDLPYFTQLQDSVSERVKLYVGFGLLMSTLPLGGWGCLAREPNIFPNLCRSIVDHFLAGKSMEMGKAYQQVLRFWDAVELAEAESNEATKPVLRVLGLPGGYARPPRTTVKEETLRKVREQLEKLNIWELEGIPRRDPA